MRRTFLTLVRSGLWNTPVDPTPFSSMNSADWEEIYQLARTQALLAITFDGVLSLPAELRPPRPLYLQWAAKVVQIEQSNLRLNEELPEVFMPYRRTTDGNGVNTETNAESKGRITIMLLYYER